jgi:hypothetical protein
MDHINLPASIVDRFEVLDRASIELRNTLENP